MASGIDILVLGAGFAGFWAAVAARRVAASADIALAARSPVLEMRPRLYEADPASLGVDLRPILETVRVRFVEAEATGADVAGRRLLTRGGALGYAQLVVATGSVLRRPPILGIDSAHSIDTQAEAMRFDRRLSQIAAKPSTVVVIGAGFTGIELALELRDRVNAHGGDGEALRIVLVDRASAVGPELGAGPRAAIEAALAQARVELRLATTVTEVAEDHVVVDGVAMPADATVVTTGMAAADFTRQVPGDRDAWDRLVVDRHLRAPQAEGIFVTGDAAAADTGDGHRALQSCQHALQLGRVAGENAARASLGLPLVAYAQPRYVTCLDLGRSGAVFTEGWDRNVRSSGAEAKAIKRRINTQVIYPPANVGREALLAMSELDPASRPAARAS